MLSLEVLLKARNIQEMLADSSSAVIMFNLKPTYCVVIAHGRYKYEIWVMWSCDIIMMISFLVEQSATEGII